MVAGTTGEGPVLTDAERIGLFRAVVDAVDVPVIASTGTNDTAHSVLLTKEAEAVGVQGVLAVTPYYNRPSPAGLQAYFRTIAGATDLPVVLYDILIRSGRRIGAALTTELAREVHNIVGVKDATGDAAAAAVVVAETPDEFDVYCGDEPLTLPFLSIGRCRHHQCRRPLGRPPVGPDHPHHRVGEVERAMTVNQQLAESYQFESTEEFPNPVPAKAACRVLGLAVGQCRLPIPRRPPRSTTGPATSCSG